MGADVTERILPLLATVAKEIPITMSSIFCPSLLKEYDLPYDVKCADLTTMDRLFATINWQ